jgi:hypothetical protein
MRLHFPNAEHPDLFWAEGRLSLGSREQHRVRIQHMAIQPDHALIDVDPVRGIELSVLERPSDVYVNGRHVQEKAILHLGDRLQLGTVQVMLKSDSDVREQPPLASDTDLRGAPIRINLRAIAGPYFGKTLALKSRSVLGRGTDCDIVLNEPQLSRQHALIENTGRGIFLRDLGSSNGTLVNGVLTRDAVLKLGDQIAFEQNRFLLESGGASPIDLMMAIKSPVAAQAGPVHTQISHKLVPAPAVPSAAAHSSQAGQSIPPPPPIDPGAEAASSAWVNKLANALMLIAALFALAGIGFLLYSELS